MRKKLLEHIFRSWDNTLSDITWSVGTCNKSKVYIGAGGNCRFLCLQMAKRTLLGECD